jgi:hypothetical protein
MAYISCSKSSSFFAFWSFWFYMHVLDLCAYSTPLLASIGYVVVPWVN